MDTQDPPPSIRLLHQRAWPWTRACFPRSRACLPCNCTQCGNVFVLPITFILVIPISIVAGTDELESRTKLWIPICIYWSKYTVFIKQSGGHVRKRVHATNKLHPVSQPTRFSSQEGATACVHTVISWFATSNSPNKFSLVSKPYKANYNYLFCCLILLYRPCMWSAITCLQLQPENVSCKYN